MKGFAKFSFKDEEEKKLARIYIYQKRYTQLREIKDYQKADWIRDLALKKFKVWFCATKESSFIKWM